MVRGVPRVARVLRRFGLAPAGPLRSRWARRRPRAASALCALTALGPALALSTPAGGGGIVPSSQVHASPHAALYRIVGCRARSGAFRGLGTSRREVAIGFDDGPAADTPAFVRMLERSHAVATFFMIGDQLGAADREMLLRELRDGDALGDHTYTHPYLTAIAGVRSQLAEPQAEIRALSGYTPCVFRPPYGAYDASIVRTAGSLGLTTVLWNVDPSDYAQPGTRAIVARVLAQVRPGSILISHDGGGPRWQTLAAYPRIISALHARGYRIVSIPQLLGLRPIYVPCVKLCDGLGVPRSALPRGAILQRAP